MYGTLILFEKFHLGILFKYKKNTYVNEGLIVANMWWTVLTDN